MCVDDCIGVSDDAWSRFFNPTVDSNLFFFLLGGCSPGKDNRSSDALKNHRSIRSQFLARQAQTVAAAPAAVDVTRYDWD